MLARLSTVVLALQLLALLVVIDGFAPPLARRVIVGSTERLRARESSALQVYTTHYEELKIETKKGIFLADLTPLLRAALKTSGVTEGVVTVLSRHTTTAITINEMEGRLVDDIRQYLLKLAPPDYPYLHNDLHLRSGPAGWPGGDEAWRAQEPVNAHSHLLTMLLGSSESVPVHAGQLKIGQWQSVILAEMDGPRTRTVAVQISGDRP